MRRFVSALAGLFAAVALACAPACGPSAPAPSAGEAHRVVSLAPAFTETLIALGAGDRVVGIGKFDPEIPGRADVPRLGDAMSVDLESLTALQPDVVLVNAQVLADRLAPVAARIRVIELPTDRLDDALRAVDEIARLMGRAQAGAALRSNIETSLDAARARAAARREKGKRPPRVLVVVQRRPYYTAGAGSFVDDLLRAVGAENVFGYVTQPWPTVSEESIVARAPELILDAAVGDVDTEQGRDALRRDWARLSTIPAVRDGHVQVIREDAIFRAGPRIPEALATLERLLYGEAPK